MCLIVFAYKKHPSYDFIFAGNRDEFYGRPTRKAQYWKRYPDLLAGKDELAGGTWVGITRDGKFATVTNFRDPYERPRSGKSRGMLPLNFLIGDEEPGTYVDKVKKRSDRYNGFNLITGHGEELYYLCNKNNEIKKLEPGIYGLSNHYLDNSWPKVVRAKKWFRRILRSESPDTERFFDLLYDDTTAREDELPDTGLAHDFEQTLSSIFVKSDKYGTRSSTLIMMDKEGAIKFDERYHEPEGKLEVNRVVKELNIKH